MRPSDGGPRIASYYYWSGDYTVHFLVWGWDLLALRASMEHFATPEYRSNVRKLFTPGFIYCAAGCPTRNTTVPMDVLEAKDLLGLSKEWAQRRSAREFLIPVIKPGKHLELASSFYWDDQRAQGRGLSYRQVVAADLLIEGDEGSSINAWDVCGAILTELRSFFEVAPNVGLRTQWIGEHSVPSRRISPEEARLLAKMLPLRRPSDQAIAKAHLDSGAKRSAAVSPRELEHRVEALLGTGFVAKMTPQELSADRPPNDADVRAIFEHLAKNGVLVVQKGAPSNPSIPADKMSQQELENALRVIQGCSDARVPESLRREISFMLLSEHAQGCASEVAANSWDDFLQRNRSWYRKMRRQYVECDGCSGPGAP